MFISSPGLYSARGSSNPCPSSCENQNYLQTLLTLPWGQNAPRSLPENHCYVKGSKRWLGGWLLERLCDGRCTGGEEAGGREAVEEAASVIQAGEQDSLGGDSPSQIHPRTAACSPLPPTAVALLLFLTSSTCLIPSLPSFSHPPVAARGNCLVRSGTFRVVWL